jgi:hypothetical protein
MCFARRFFLLFSLVSLFATSGRAVVVDWDGLTWTPGTLTNSYNVGPAQAGNDITVTVSGNTGQLQPEVLSPYPQTPAITTNFQGGLGTIGIHDITFTPVPEINPTWSAVGSCILAAALILRHSAKFRK